VPIDARDDEVRITPKNVEQLRALFNEQLRHRRAFVTGAFELTMQERCLLVVEAPLGRRFSVEAEVVYIRTEEPGAGVGLELVGLDASRVFELEQFVYEGELVPSHDVGSETSHEAATAHTLYDRIRKLSLRERENMARQGRLTERVALERCYGSSVWEALLQNPQLTVAEVAHIAKNGTLPVPLVAVIVANHSWLASGEVRRALLSNPRASGGHLERVLKAMSRIELKQLVQASPYRAQVKTAAKKLFGE
jgi:hypothetical protein